MRKWFNPAVFSCFIYVSGCVEVESFEPGAISIQHMLAVCPSADVPSAKLETVGSHSLWKAQVAEKKDALYYVSYVTDECTLAFRYSADLPTPYFFHMAEMIVPNNHFTVRGHRFSNFVTSARLAKTLTRQRLVDCDNASDPKACIARIHKDNLENSISLNLGTSVDIVSNSEAFIIDLVGGKNYFLGKEIHDE